MLRFLYFHHPYHSELSLLRAWRIALIACLLRQFQLVALLSDALSQLTLWRTFRWTIRIGTRSILLLQVIDFAC